jgi:hypothetical protein
VTQYGLQKLAERDVHLNVDKEFVTKTKFLRLLTPELTVLDMWPK